MKVFIYSSEKDFNINELYSYNQTFYDSYEDCYDAAVKEFYNYFFEIEYQDVNFYIHEVNIEATTTSYSMSMSMTIDKLGTMKNN